MSNLKIFTKNIEDKALEQVNTLIAQDAFKDAKIRIMPDVHAGAGCVIGFTGDLGDKVIPNIVGVDIGCGMLTIELSKKIDNLEGLDNFITKNIPNGFNVSSVEKCPQEFLELFKCYDELASVSRLKKSLGSLGGGNHFIEIDTDGETDYLVIHTGSRNLGLQVADLYQKKAEDYIKKLNGNNISEIIQELKKDGMEKEIEAAIKKAKENEVHIPRELSYIEGEDREDYLHDMKLAQEFAVENRKNIAMLILEYLKDSEDIQMVDSFETIHNYIDLESNIVRKGAISAKEGEKVIIPINMRDGCIIATGKGNEDWNYSAPHGAGRILSRAAAKSQISLEDFQESMKDVYTTSVDTSTIDESPFAYKSIDEILSNIVDTVEVDKIIKPIYNFKAKG